MECLESSFSQCGSKSAYASHYLKYLSHIMESIDVVKVEEMITAIEKAGEEGRTIYLIGNGGSAVTASHLARDIGIGTRAQGKKIFKAVSLVDNVAVITAIANDEDYSKVFVRQLEALLQPGDLVISFSVSGNSPNVIKAIEYAREKGAITAGCTGFDGGALRKLVDISLHIPTPRGEYGPVEDIFMVLGHLIISYLQMERCGHL